MPRSPYVKTLSIAAWSQPGGPGRRLRQLDLELTERCNFNCLHCTINRPADDADAEASEMSLEKIVEILRQATALGVLTVRFTGGEPLLRPDFDDIYQAARGLGLRVSLFTNASLITIRKAELFSRVLPLEPVEVSIYGMTEATAAAATQTKGARQAVSRGLKLLEMYGVKFIPKFVLLPPNQAEFTEFRRWAGERPGALHTPAFVLPSDLRARRDSGAANARLAKLRLQPAQAAAFGAAESDEPQRELRAFCRAQCGPQGPGLFGCGAGTETACIDAYGQFQLCLRLRHPETTAALGRDGLAGALSSFVPKVRRRKAQDARYLERCAVCFLKPLCEQCPASSWIESGKLDAPVEYHCRITHAQAFTLGFLEKGEQAWKVKDWRRRLDGPAAGGRDVRSART